MSNAHPAAPDTQIAIQVPEQLQQAKLPDGPMPVDIAAQQLDATSRSDGILGQLESERGHD